MKRIRKPDGTRDRRFELKAESMHLDGVQPLAFVQGSATPKGKLKTYKDKGWFRKLVSAIKNGEI